MWEVVDYSGKRGVGLTHWEGWNKLYPLQRIHFKNLNPNVSAINSLTHRGCRDVFAEGEDVITCRVISKRAPKGIALSIKKSLDLSDRLSKS